jgi:demethylmacrocin O-methyltransferase
MKYLKEKVKNNFSKKNVRRLKNFYQDIKAFGFGFNLSKLGKIYGTDKIGGHFYTQHYQKHFRDFKLKKIMLLEIGVGGYEKPDSGATSLRMWKKYFPFGKIYAIDIYDKSLLQEKRIKIFKGSQIDVPFLDKCIDEIGSLDLIVDDGSHINEHVIKTFNILFPKLKDGGIYVVEDTQTSYWKSYGGDSYDLNNSKTMMNYFKSLTDCLNNKEFINPTYLQTYFDKKIISIHFYHNLIFIYKGNNDEESMWVKNNSK